MSNLIRIIGGVAAAGSVAAGASAFTASGITKDASLTSGFAVGGSVDVTVNNAAKLLSAKVTQTTTDPDQLTGVNVELTDMSNTALANTATVKVRTTGTGGTAVSGSWTACTKGSGNFWNCPLTGYYLTLSTLDVAVIPA